MGVIKIPPLNLEMSQEELINTVAKYLKEMAWLLDRNIDNGNIRAKSIKADRLDVLELSAITADLGKVLAGILIGAYISTADGTYPRIDFSSEDNLLKAMTSASKYFAINPYDTTSTPSIDYRDNDLLIGAKVYLTALGLSLVGISNTNININTSGSGNINLNPGGYVTIDLWSKLLNEATSRTLQQDLDAKANASGANGSFTTANGKTVVVSNGIITSIT